MISTRKLPLGVLVVVVSVSLEPDPDEPTGSGLKEPFTPAGSVDPTERLTRSVSLVREIEIAKVEGEPGVMAPEVEVAASVK